MTEETKYWITDLRGTSVKSPYEVRFTLMSKPENEDEIKAWLKASFKSSFVYRVVESYTYAEIFFKNESDSTAFVLKWGESFI